MLKQSLKLSMAIMEIKTSYLTKEQHNRLSQIIEPDLLSIILEYGFLAGGSVVYVLVDDIPLSSVGDLDIFINTSEQLQRCAHQIVAYWNHPGIFFQRQSATLKIYCPSKLPIQLILTDKDVNQQILGFDCDYVQCAIEKNNLNGSLNVVRSQMAKMAHKTKVIKYMLDYAYNPMRLCARIRKAYKKGFKLPRDVTTIDQIGVRLYRPRHLDDKQWQREIYADIHLQPINQSNSGLIEYCWDYVSHEPTSTHKLKQALKSPMTYFSQIANECQSKTTSEPEQVNDLTKALSDPLTYFNRADYDGVKQPHEPTTSYQYIYMDHCPDGLILPENVRPFQLLQPQPKKETYRGRQIKQLKTRLEQEPNNDRLFYMIRALELIE